VIDTLAATIKIEDELSADLFQGGAAYEDFATGRSHERIWRNPEGDAYEPRLTWWPESGTLKVECSLPKLLGYPPKVMTTKEVDAALDALDAWLQDWKDGLPPVRIWKAQRVDYVYVWDVSPLPVGLYLSALSRLNLAAARRHSFKGEGVVWKNGSRWVKFYDKSKEQLTDGHLLRFEVSNYADGVRYMCDEWFQCEQTIAQVTRLDRALYVLRYVWRKLGLDVAVIGQMEATAHDIRAAFGASAGSAYWHLMLVTEYGRDAVRLGLTSSSSFDVWRSRLRAAGLLAVAGDHVVGVDRRLPDLHLPQDAANLGVSLDKRGGAPDKNFLVKNHD